jgi:hypothetical protein
MCNRVLFPAPEAPSIATISPGMILSSTPFKTSMIFPLFPKMKDFLRPWVRNNG